MRLTCINGTPSYAKSVVTVIGNMKDALHCTGAKPFPTIPIWQHHKKVKVGGTAI